MTVLQTIQSLEGTSWQPGDGSNATIDSWLTYIGNAYPDEAAYCRSLHSAGYFSWCGLTQAYAFSKNGIRPVFGPTDVTKWAYAMGWLQNWGTPVTVANAQPGDVVIWDMGGGDHHVTCLKENLGGGKWVCLGGNQSHTVKESTYDTNQFKVMGVRRPPTAIASTQPQPTTAPIPALSSGKCSWYGQYTGSHNWTDNADDPNSNALGVPDNRQGISFFNHATLGHWFAVKNPLDGKFYLVPQCEIGPNPNTGRAIDIHARTADAWGYSPTNFPTNAVLQWYPASPPPGTESLTAKQQVAAYTQIKTMDEVFGSAQPPAQPIPTSSDADIKWMQTVLKAKAGYTDLIDGEVGPNTIAAMIQYVKEQEPPVTSPSTNLPVPVPQQPDIATMLAQILAQLQQQKTTPTQSAPAPTIGPNPMGAALTALLPWIISVLPQIGAIGLAIMQAMVSGGVVGPAIGAGATPTGSTVGAGLAATVGVGILNWVKTALTTKWQTPAPQTGAKS